MNWIVFALVVVLVLAAYTWGIYLGLRRGAQIGTETTMRRVSSW